MRNFEYKAIPAPYQGKKARGVKTTEDRFALSLTDALNEMAADGWEYVRAETLPCDERKGLTGTQTTFQNILVFRRLEAQADPLTLDPSPRVVSVTPPRAAGEFDGEAPAASTPTVSEPAQPRRISASLTQQGAAPPLGSAHDD